MGIVGASDDAVPVQWRPPKKDDQAHTEMSMKTFVLTATLLASILAAAGSVQAAPRDFDGAKFWQEQASRGW